MPGQITVGMGASQNFPALTRDLIVVWVGWRSMLRWAVPGLGGRVLGLLPVIAHGR